MNHFYSKYLKQDLLQINQLNMRTSITAEVKYLK